ncbi:putative aliphatic sulfonates transport permease protein SsuC [Hartmannibacter diazotrophicus]|uniref:Putative aliphatic sulfonates transport permease protein SsuC n=1 Tax=Hartmannibacter diazotrophicus TaxID=1482074 RepID=A0A2C9D8W0_9HYPH|nr:ABC transporter permease [Hartmannibacter diazotrophicus]SON56696.1 putative aliphatic sulfonates transport permease protein SsuC [Hartmannibacter diazotrophicus]
MANKHIVRLLPWVITIGFFVLWELACVLFSIDRFILPRPSAIAVSIFQNAGTIVLQSWYTLFTTLAGFAVAVAVGLFLGLLVGASPLVYRGVYPIMVGLNSVPKVAIVPILVIWFGIGAVPAIITAFVISFFPIMVNVATGLATIEPELNDVLRSLGASKFQILRKVGLPRTMPYFFASLKVAVTLAFIGSVVAETVAGDRGIGYLMMAASARFDVTLVFAGLIVIGVMGVVMYEVFAVLERRVTFWATRGNDIAAAQ